MSWAGWGNGLTKKNGFKGLGATAQVQVRVRDGRRKSVDGSKATVSVVVASRESSCGAEQQSAMPGGDRNQRERKRRRETARSGCAKGRGDDAVPEQGCSTPVLCRSSAEEAAKNLLG
ncbi:hypothetical protein U1Q18_004790 [Sarracenia purpurea var. burkii]